MLYHPVMNKSKWGKAMSLEDDYKAMVARLCKPGDDIVTGLDAEKAHVWHMATGLAGEFLEYSIAGFKEDEDNILEEFGDMLFYLTALRQVYGAAEVEIHGELSPEALADLLIPSVEGVLDLAKKYAIYGKPMNECSMRQHLGRLNAVFEFMTSGNDFTIESAMRKNMEKLEGGENARYKEGKYSDKAAQERRDKQ